MFSGSTFQPSVYYWQHTGQLVLTVSTRMVASQPDMQNHEGGDDRVVDSGGKKDSISMERNDVADDGDYGVTRGFVSSETQPLLAKKIPGSKPRQGKCYVRKQYEVLFMVFLGYGVLLSMRINLSVVVPAMTNSSFTTTVGGANDTAHTCQGPNGTLEDEQNGGTFLWSAHDQELVLAAFYYGYALSHLPFGFLTDKIGGTRVFGTGILLSGTFCLLGPLAAEAGSTYIIIVRFLSGLGEGGTVPAIGAMTSRWFVGEKSSQAFSIASAGGKFGSFFGTILSGVLASSNILGGWPATFYMFGGFSIVVVLVWVVVIYEYPAHHPRISAEELASVSRAAVTEKTSVDSVPIKSILSSIPVWTVIACSFIGMWTNQTVFTNQPLYLKHVQGMDIELIGLVSALPFVAEGTTLMVGAIVATKLIEEKILSVAATRRLMTLTGLGASSLAFLGLGFTECNSALSVVLLTAAVGFNGIGSNGYYVNAMDIAPRFGGSLLGLVNGASAVSGILAPYMIGVFTTNQSDINGWQTVFFISSGLNVFGCLVFTVFSSGEEQEWAKAPPDQTEGSTVK